MSQLKQRQNSDTPEVKPSFSVRAAPGMAWLLFLGALQGLLAGSALGGCLGLALWRNAEDDVSAKAVRNCSCPALMCPDPVCIIPPHCVSRLSDHFMKAEPDVHEYHNKRLQHIQHLFSMDELEWIVKSSGAEKIRPGTVLVFPKESPWLFMYKRIHGEILAQNKELWHYHLPPNVTSQLVEDLTLIAYDNSTVFPHEQELGHDIGTLGGTGKRVLSAAIVLNEGFEGGNISVMLSMKPYELTPSPGMMWIWNSFLLRKKKPVTSGVQYVLYYFVRRY